MLSKRIFWLTCAAAIASWLVWVRLRQRQDEFANTTPQFAPPRTFTPPPSSIPPPAAPEAPASAPASSAPEQEEELAAASASSTPEQEEELATPALASEATLPNSADSPADVAEAVGGPEAEISGYCMRCKTKRPIQDAHRETTESGRPAARGTCPVCGANMFTFLATDDDT